MIERIFDIQGFSGWESDDIYRWPKDSFYSAENVEVRKNLSWIQLASKLVDTAWTITGTIISMENLETIWIWTTSGVIVCTSTGLVYLNGVLKQTINTGTTEWNQIIGIWVLTVSSVQYIYYVTKTSSWAGKIHRSTTDLATWNISYKAYTVATDTTVASAFLINTWDYLHIAVKNKIVNIYTVAEVVSDALVLPEKEKITWFTQFQNSFKIYTNLGSTGVQYIWDGTDTVVSYRQTWLNQPVLWVVNDGALDYAILWFSSAYSGLYLISWTQKQEIRVNLETSAYSRLLSGNMSIRKSIVYISGGWSWESSNYGIYTYGLYYPWTPKSLVQQYSLSTNAFSFHCHSTAESYFANADGKVWYIEHNNPPTTTGYATSGYVDSQIHQGNIWEEKSFKKMKVGFKLQLNSYIEIYVRTSLGATWLLAKTISYATYSTKKQVTVFENELKALWIGNFNELQVRIKMYGSSYYTPTVLRVTTFLEVVNNL